jgi:hypothetical protein
LTHRFVVSACASLLGLAAVLGVHSALADKPGDAQALKALNRAIDDDYLQTKFDAALDRLKGALDKCGDDCTPAVKARLHTAIGTVLAGGKKQLDDAKDAFVEALKIDPKAAPDAAVSTAEVSFAYDNARKELNLGGAASALPTNVQHLPPAEQQKSTPVPLYVALPAELREKVDRITVSYLAPGKSDWKNLVMKQVGEFGYGINVPCTDLREVGTLKYHFLIADKSGAVLASVGSRAEPLTVPIKDHIELDPPHWPGFAPPEMCANVEASHDQCLDDRQCNSGLVCEHGACVTAPPKPKEGARQNWVSLNFIPDISIVSGKDICTAGSQSGNHFVCYGGDGKTRYTGTPTLGIADNVKSGPALSTLRLAFAYDRLILDNITAGLRVGIALGGATSDGAKFLPLHAELRGAYWIGKSPFERMGVRPFVFLSGGIAQFDTKITTQVLEDGTACGAANPADRNSPCTKPTNATGNVQPRIQNVTAYKQAGNGFVGLGGGVSYVPAPAVALNLALRASITMPVVMAILSPEVGVALGF